MSYYIGMDFGGTSGRIKIVDEKHQVLIEKTGAGCSMNTDGIELSVLRYQQLLDTCLTAAHLQPEACQGLCIAASGVDSKKYYEGCQQAFVSYGIPRQRILVENDCEIFLSDPALPAIVVISGTGSIAFGENEAGERVRCGGWNHIVSDEGSGYWLGLAVLKQIGDYLDQRDKDGELFRLYSQQSQIKTLEALNDYLNETLDKKAEIGSYARLLEPAYHNGSVQAQNIMLAAAQRLATLVLDTNKKMGDSSGQPVSVLYWGSVLVQNEVIRTAVAEYLQKQMPLGEFRAPATSALDLAVLKALRGGLLNSGRRPLFV